MTPPSPKKTWAQKIAVCPDDLRMTLPQTVKMKEKIRFCLQFLIYFKW